MDAEHRLGSIATLVAQGETTIDYLILFIFVVDLMHKEAHHEQ